MQIRSTQLKQNYRAPSQPAVTKSEQGQPPAGETFTFSHPHREKGGTSLFHRATGAIAGGMTGAVAGTILLSPMGNGMGGDGLIYPIVGFIGGGLMGTVGGALVAGSAESTEESTSLLHRSTGNLIVSILELYGCLLAHVHPWISLTFLEPDMWVQGILRVQYLGRTNVAY